MTKREVADEAGVSVSTVNRAIREGQLRAAKTRPNGAVRIRYAWVLDWLKPRNVSGLFVLLVLDDRVQAAVTALASAVALTAVCNCYLHVCFPGHPI